MQWKETRQLYVEGQEGDQCRKHAINNHFGGPVLTWHELETQAVAFQQQYQLGERFQAIDYFNADGTSLLTYLAESLDADHLYVVLPLAMPKRLPTTWGGRGRLASVHGVPPRARLGLSKRSGAVVHAGLPQPLAACDEPVSHGCAPRDGGRPNGKGSPCLSPSAGRPHRSPHSGQRSSDGRVHWSRPADRRYPPFLGELGVPAAAHAGVAARRGSRTHRSVAALVQRHLCDGGRKTNGTVRGTDGLAWTTHENTLREGW